MPVNREMRVGTGFDVHALEPGRKLILGGVEIPFEKGLSGHSDADVLIHAIMDALLGASGCGDIGRHFPDSEPKYKGISSLVLLGKVAEIAASKGYEVGNIDATVIAEKPKLAPYVEEMIKATANALGVKEDQLNIKATTTEKLGFTGREEGIAAQAVCALRQAIFP
jgi:2-C-methyl-D-erythritol 2,4-cyclodiphosphate synthase